jgi:glutathione S-transferase
MLKETLTYFNARGRAEVARLCLAAAGIKYEDVRVEQADWPTLKPSKNICKRKLLGE